VGGKAGSIGLTSDAATDRYAISTDPFPDAGAEVSSPYDSDMSHCIVCTAGWWCGSSLVALLSS